MNWGHKIMMVYALFVAGMVFLAYQSSRQNIELVTKDYYAKELVYQQKIDEAKRTGLLTSPVNIQVIGHEVRLQFPADFKSKALVGQVTLYCPSDETKDMNQSFNIIDSVVVVTIPATNQGLHYVKISWVAEGLQYYVEKKIII